MQVVWLLLGLLAASEATFIRVNNTGTENFVIILEAEGHDAESYGIIEPGNFTELFTLDEWTGSFYTYPEECANLTCDYPITKISVSFSTSLFDSFYDFLMIDLNRGFNLPASIKSLTRTDCDIKCDVNLLDTCPEEDQVRNSEDVLVACATSVTDYQDWEEKCPQARIDGTDLHLGICASADYEFTFG